MTKILREKQTFKADKAFTVKKLDLELPNGKKISHYIAERVPTVTVFPLTSKYEVYLISQYRYLLKKTVLEAVAGRVDEGETFLASAKRELKEEAGITASVWEELARIEFGASFVRAPTRIFLATELEIGKQELEEDETIELVKMPLDEAVAKVMSGEIYLGSSIIGILMLDRLRREKKL